MSDLPDGVLGHILSFPTKEAARSAALARSWRHKFAYLDTISFGEYVVHCRDNDYTFPMEAVDCRSKNGEFLEDINAAPSPPRCAGDRNIKAAHLPRPTLLLRLGQADRQSVACRCQTSEITRARTQIMREREVIAVARRCDFFCYS
ncbi:hypothetical protein ZWY2020_005515 [Hordeum vulgare]|nr:hypothetical protein ZWY2020_005515 [Hordeum vulgare]